MNCNICDCESPLSNLGFDCTTPFGIPAMGVLVPTFDDDGNINGILKTQALTKAYFDSMTNHADASKRWYVLPQFKNVGNTRGDAKFFEYDDQSTEFVSETARKFMATIGLTSGNGAVAPAMKKQIESARCTGGMSIFLFSEKRQILCKNSDDNLSSLPIEIDAQSVYAGFVFSTKDQNQHYIFSFNFSITEEDSNFTTIDCTEISGYDILMMKSLLDMCYDLIDVTPTTLKIKIRTKGNFGTSRTPPTLDDLVASDFISSDSAATSKIFNETDQADVSITGVVENPAGTYELTFAAQTLGDVLVPLATKTGYDMTCMAQNPVDIDS